MFNSQQPIFGGTFRPPPRPRNAQNPLSRGVNTGNTGMGLNFPRPRATDTDTRPSLVPTSNSPSGGVESASSCKSTNVQFGMLDNPTLEARLDSILRTLENVDAKLNNTNGVIKELCSRVAGLNALLQALVENMNSWTSEIEGLVRQQQAQPQGEEQNTDWFLPQ
ncbi:hypothetical protein QBC46DRAFT_414165 [Diplogelasinospora grovesii]|uniref:Uncharacterized protein n=1 Tax=Diplogelasinospora grovesii TaxID=303347 RepID=A0AAN6MW48_9PEZI|nr:hypothetical protein QBC46DRAFT_414165 [Diplogelasinospora grovesii]